MTPPGKHYPVVRMQTREPVEIHPEKARDHTEWQVEHHTLCTAGTAGCVPTKKVSAGGDSERRDVTFGTE